MIHIDSVTQRYGAIVALDNVSLEIRSGEFFGLLGPNGAGKTTLMSLLSGFRAATAGTIRIDGAAFSPGNFAARRKIGLVPQSIALYTDMTADENLSIFGRLAGLSGAALKTRATAVLEAVQLADRRRDPVKNFSGGMQRRLNLAVALLHEPAILLCDEPTVGIDPQSRNAIFDLLGSINAAGTTIIYSTHYMEEAERLCSRIGVIDHGRILALGTLDELLQTLPFEEEVQFASHQAPPELIGAARSMGEFVETNGLCRMRPGAGSRLSDFFRATEDLGVPARVFSLKRPGLEEVFLQLTGRTMRDE
ncbi:MAG TPA: ABC transporter ATP-binding protein [Opitutaceae bacterium]|nr:ABC transporter ATP-binding protein [Opitutaceae bacterium]